MTHKEYREIKFVSIKFYWNTAILLGFCIVYDCCYMTTAELTSGDTGCMATRLKFTT